jgi:hypothetical protein
MYLSGLDSKEHCSQVERSLVEAIGHIHRAARFNEKPKHSRL